MNTNTRYAINAASNWVMLVCNALLSIITLPLAVNGLGEYRYGIYEIVGSVVVFVSLLDAGLSAAVTRFSSQHQSAGDMDRLRETVCTAMLILGALGLAGAVVLIAVTPLVSYAFTIELPWIPGLWAIHVCMAVTLFLRFISVPDQGILIGANRYDLKNSVEIAGMLVRLAFLVGLFKVFTPSLLSFGMSFVAQGVVRVLGFRLGAWLYVTRKHLYRLRFVSKSAAKRIFGFSSLQMLNLVGNLSVAQGLKFIIGHTIGVEMLSYFAPTSRAVAQLGSVVTGLSSPLVPLGSRAMTRDNRNQVGDLGMRFGRLSAVLATSIALPIICLARPLLALWIGEKFAWTAPILAIWMFAQLLMGVQSAAFFLALGGGNIRPYAMSQFLAGIASLIFAYLGELAFGWGLMGIVATAAFVLSLRNGIYLPILFCREHGLSVPAYYYEVFVRPLFPAPASALLGLTFADVVPAGSLLILGLQGVMVAATYWVGAWWLSMTTDDKRRLHRLFAGLSASRKHDGGTGDSLVE